MWQRLVQAAADHRLGAQPIRAAQETATSGTVRAAPATSSLDARRTSAVASWSGPTMKPGVSTSETIGRPNASKSRRKRAALSDAAAVIVPARCFVSLAMTPTGRPSMRASAVTISGANRARSTTTDPSSHKPSITGTTS